MKKLTVRQAFLVLNLIAVIALITLNAYNQQLFTVTDILILLCIVIVLFIFPFQSSIDNTIDFTIIDKKPFNKNEYPVLDETKIFSVDVIILQKNSEMTIGYYSDTAKQWFHQKDGDQIHGNFKWIYKPEYLNLDL